MGRTVAGDTNWDEEIGALLADLSAVQGDLLGHLGAKRVAIAAGNREELDGFGHREEELVKRLAACHERRQQLLEVARQEGRPHGNLRDLTRSLPGGSKQYGSRLEQAGRNTRLLQHHSLTNWVLLQRSLLHLSQLIEIIASGGRQRSTYGKQAVSSAQGALMDRAV